MGLFDKLVKPISNQYVASPPEAAGMLVYRFPNQSIPNGAQLTVRSDERVVFYRDGKLFYELDTAGRYALDTEHLPFLAGWIGSATGGNRAITELYFVRKSEYLHRLHRSELGTFTDPETLLLVALGFRAHFGARVTDPAAIISRIGGHHEAPRDEANRPQGPTISSRILTFLDDRLTSILASVVGGAVRSLGLGPFLSNEISEGLGQELVQKAGSELAADGLQLTRFLSLAFELDPISRCEVERAHAARSNLGLQKMGAQLARDPGFQAYVNLQNQTKVMEGLATGLAAGTASLPSYAPLGGFGGYQNLLAPLPTMRRAEPLDPGPPKWSGAPAAKSEYFVRDPSGDMDGPFSISALPIRLESTPGALVRVGRSGAWATPQEIPEVATAVERRSRSIPSSQAGAPKPGESKGKP